MSDEISEEDRELLKQEYDNLFTQFAHWDNQTWTKHRFFIIIESAFLGGGFQVVGPQILSGETLSAGFLYFGISVALFNIFLSYVWFRSTRRVREYLEPRLERARKIELTIDSEVAWKSFVGQDEFVSEKGSSRWELRLPKAFLFIWFLLGLVFTWSVSKPVAGAWCALVLLPLLYFEKGMWFGTKDIRDYDPDYEKAHEWR